MKYSDATDSYQAEFLENILGTDFLYGVPYKIDREKYEATMKAYNEEIRIKDADVVVFHADYNKSDDEPERGIYSYAFFTWPENSPEGSEDFYDVAQFWDWHHKDKHKEIFESFVRDILKSVISVDKEYLGKLIGEKIAERNKMNDNIEILNTLL